MRAAYGYASVAIVVAKTLGGRIREARERAKLSQAALGDAVGVRGPTVFRWEKDQMVPEDPTLERIAGALGTSAAWLRYGVESRVERDDIPESFRLWREQWAPADLPPEIEERMLSTGFRYAPEDAWRWNTIHQEVVAEMRGRRVASSVKAQDEETARARAEAEAAGLMKPKRRKS